MYTRDKIRTCKRAYGFLTCVGVAALVSATNVIPFVVENWRRVAVAVVAILVIGFGFGGIIRMAAMEEGNEQGN